MTDQSVHDKLTQLRAIFYRHGRHQAIETEFDRLLSRRRSEVSHGVSGEARGIALLGASGSGKTTAVDRLLTRHKNLTLPEEGQLQADVVSFRVPSPATLKDVGMAALSALGYPLQRDRSAGMIWEQVRFFLKERQTLFLHIDEAQDLYTVRGEQAQANVINTLKSLMQTKEWPVGLILSGMPNVKGMLNADPQLGRRFYPIELRPVSVAADEEMLRDLLRAYLEKAQLKQSSDLVGQNILERLAHAGAYEFGLIIEILLGAAEEALFEEVSILEPKHFVRAFRRRSSCMDGLNPFVVADFRTIDARKLLNPDEG